MEINKQPQKKIAAKLLILLLVCLAPMIGALFLYQVKDDLRFVTKNTGQLIQPPVALSTLKPLDEQGHPVNLDPKTPRWWLVLYTPEVCDIKCAEVVAYFSTLHLSLSEHQHRLGEFLFTQGPMDLTTVPQAPDLHVAKITAPLPSTLPLYGGYGLWIMDPQGNIILSYDPANLDNRPLLDLRHLLKVSRIG